MIVVADVGPLHYLVLIGADHILPQLFPASGGLLAYSI